MSTSYNKQKGSLYERDLVRYFRSKGIDAERLRLAGKEDEGDVCLKIGGQPFIVEAKNTKQFDLAGWVGEAHTERDNYDAHRGLEACPSGFLVAHKRRMRPVSESYVTLPLWHWLEQVGPPF